MSHAIDADHHETEQIAYEHRTQSGQDKRCEVRPLKRVGAIGQSGDLHVENKQSKGNSEYPVAETLDAALVEICDCVWAERVRLAHGDLPAAK